MVIYKNRSSFPITIGVLGNMSEHMTDLASSLKAFSPNDLLVSQYMPPLQIYKKSRDQPWGLLQNTRFPGKPPCFMGVSQRYEKTPEMYR